MATAPKTRVDTQSKYISYKPSYPDKLLIFEKVLPVPPSVNAMYSHGRGGTYLNREVVVFRQQVLETVGVTGHTPYDDRLAVDIFVTAKNYARRDMDNLNKCLLDAMTKANVWVDDFQIDDVRTRRAASQKLNAHVLVRVYRLNDLHPQTEEKWKIEKFYKLFSFIKPLIKKLSDEEAE